MNPGSDFKLVDFYFPLFKDFAFTSGTKESTNQPGLKSCYPGIHFNLQHPHCRQCHGQ